MLVKVGAFDIDGTYFRSSLLIEVIRCLITNGVFPAAAWAEVAELKAAWKNRQGSYTAYLRKVIEVHDRYLAGVPVELLNAAVQLTLHQQRDRVYAYTRDLFRELRAAGYHLVTISGSPSYIVRRFAEYVGFDGYVAADFQTEGDVYTRRVGNEDVWHNKARALQRYLADTGIEYDASASVAIGDTVADIGLMELVGRPIPFNPDSGLRAWAIEHSVDIILERKDGMYQLQPGGFTCLHSAVSPPPA